MHLDLAGQDYLLELAGPDPLHRPRHRLLEMGRRHGARNRRAPGRRRIDQGQRRRPERVEPAPAAMKDIVLGVIGRHLGVEAEPRLPLLAGQRHLGHDQRGAGEPRPRRRGGPPVRERESTDGDQPRPGRPRGRVPPRGRRQRGPSRAHAREPVPLGWLERPEAAQRGDGRSVTVGLFEAEPAFAGPTRGGYDLGWIWAAGHGRADADQDAVSSGPSAPQCRRDVPLQTSLRTRVEPAVPG